MLSLTIQRLLRVHPHLKHVPQHLRVALRLHEPAHDAKGRVQGLLPRKCRKTGNDGVVRPLVRADAVGMRGPRVRKAVAAVLEGEAAPPRYDPRT